MKQALLFLFYWWEWWNLEHVDNLLKFTHLTSGRMGPKPMSPESKSLVFPPFMLSNHIHVGVLFCKMKKEEKMVSGKFKHTGLSFLLLYPWIPFSGSIILALQNINIVQENSRKKKVRNEDSPISLNTFTVTPFDWQIQRGFSVTSITLPRTVPSLVSMTNAWS